MKKIYLVQVLRHDKKELQNYQYCETYSNAKNVANLLQKNELLNIDYVRIKEIIVTK